jgi:hypothetical protein
MNSEFDGRWAELGREAMKQVKQWRLSHPKASLDQIEQALDEQLGRGASADVGRFDPGLRRGAARRIDGETSALSPM